MAVRMAAVKLFMGISTLWLLAGLPIASADSIPFELDLIYPRNATYAAGFQFIYIMAWNGSAFFDHGRNFAYWASISDVTKDSPKVVSTSGPIESNLLGQTAQPGRFSSEAAHDTLPPGQYRLSYTLGVQQGCGNITDLSAFYNVTNNLFFTITDQPGAPHPNGSDMFVPGFSCQGVNIPVTLQNDTGTDCLQVDTSNAAAISHDSCPLALTRDELSAELKGYKFNPDIPYASQTALPTQKSSTSTGLAMAATPAPALLAAGVGLAGLAGIGAAVL